MPRLVVESCVYAVEVGILNLIIVRICLELFRYSYAFLFFLFLVMCM